MDAVDVAQTFVGTHAGQPAVAKFLAYVGLKPPAAWCLAFALFVHHQTSPASPYPRLARCSLFWSRITSNELAFKTFTPEDVSWGVAHPQRNDIAIFRHGGSVSNWSGHAATVIEDLGHGRFRSIEGNTSANAHGDQRMGGVVAEKVRWAGIRGFTLQGFGRERHP